jgi:cell division protein FtsI/penicillin-binding protein 2
MQQRVQRRRAHPAISRIRIISFLLLIVGFLIIVRLYYVQVMRHDYYLDRAERQYVHTASNIFSRGSIFFTTKDNEYVSAASIKNGYVLAMNPRRITDVDTVYATLSEFISLDEEWFKERATWTERSYIEIEQRIDEAVATEIAEQRLPGIALYRNQWRYYPGEEVSARSLGFVGFTTKDNVTMRGVYGLERYYDDILFRNPEVRTVNFFAEIFSDGISQGASNDNISEREGNVVTHIEPTVARMLDRILQETQEKYSSTITGGVIMDPQTGAIYALNTIPTFDLNNRTGVPVEQFQNPLVENVYEMGSIIKALTLAAGLDSGVITPTTTFYDTGELRLDSFTIRNFDKRARGEVDMQSVISNSLNTGVAHIVEKMGRDSFREYFKKLQLGSETGIDLPSETTGLVANLMSPRRVEYATASFGQGIAMTPIATARALAALGNGGYMVTPHLAHTIEYTDGSVRSVRYPKGAQVWSEESSETVSRMLVRVVDEALRGGRYALPNHTIAAKTGTAQIAHPNGGYYDDRFLHSFFGYFPAFDPKFLILLYTVEPKGVQYASETLTEPFMDLTKFLINYYNLPPDR